MTETVSEAKTETKTETVSDAKTDSPSFRIIYYNFGGRAEALRNAAAIGGIAFEDDFITFEEQKQQKADGERRWSGPPEVVILDKDGKDLVTIAQSNACLRYIGKISGLYPSNPVQQALVDEVLDSIEDLSVATAGVLYFAGDDDEKKQKLEAFNKDTLPYWSAKFEARLEENEKRGNKNGYFVGNNITIADLKGAAGYSFISSYRGPPGAKDIISKCKRLTALIDKVNNNETVKGFKAEFDKNVKTNAENKETFSFKYKGKTVCGGW
eukprot:205512_1